MKRDYGEYALAAGFFWILALLVVPLPPMALDLFLFLPRFLFPVRVHDDFGLFPPLELEVVVNRRHEKDALLPHLVGADLDDHRQHLDDEHRRQEAQVRPLAIAY